MNIAIGIIIAILTGIIIYTNYVNYPKNKVIRLEEHLIKLWELQNKRKEVEKVMGPSENGYLIDEKITNIQNYINGILYIELDQNKDSDFIEQHKL